MSQAPQQNLPSKILVVDDDISVAQTVEEQLNSRYNIKLDKAINLENALYLFNTQRYDVALVEMDFGPMAGIAMVQKWRKHDVIDKASTAFVLLSGNKNVGANNDGLIKELGDIEVLVKPFNLLQVLPYLSRGVACKKRMLAFKEMKEKIVSFYEKSGEFDKAAAQVQKKLPELGVKGLHLLYELYEKAGRFEDALALVNPMLERDGNNPALLNAKGRLLMRLGRHAEAQAVLGKSNELAPQNLQRLNDLAEVNLHLKNPDASIKHYSELLTLNPDDPELKFSMFSKLYEHGFDEQAVAFGKQTAKPMEIVRFYNNKGVALSKSGQVQEAIIEYQRALRFFPTFKENYRIYYNIALAHLGFKSREAYDEAGKSLRKCLELSPDFDKAKKALEQVDKALAPRKAPPAA